MKNVLDETLLDKFKRLFKDIEKDILPEASLIEKVMISMDFLYEKTINDIELIDYVQYNFYGKKRSERKKFITHGKLLKIIKICNNPKFREIFDNKIFFNKDFNDLLGRKWIDASTADSTVIHNFLAPLSEVFIKQPDGMFGKGIDKIPLAECKDIEALIKSFQDNHLLLEEVIKQHPSFEEFNDTSVNSMRIVTLVKANNEVEVMAAVLRLGRKGKVADNFHHFGLAALIDIETGIVYSEGVDREWRRYVLHPDSKKTIVGFQIPFWDNVIQTVKNAAKIHPEVRYVGWDITIQSDGRIALIEGNPGADPDVTQIQDQVGKWPKFEKEIEKIENLKEE